VTPQRVKAEASQKDGPATPRITIGPNHATGNLCRRRPRRPQRRRASEARRCSHRSVARFITGIRRPPR
jgi:hypothetical protein